MKKLVWIAAGIALAAGAHAQEQRRTINPLAIYGQWIGAPGTAPEDCNGDGYLIAFGSTDGKTFLMTVQHRQNGIAPLQGKQTEYDVMAPPAGAPARVEIFLTSKSAGNLGVHVRTGSQIELVPPGPDNSYSQTSLVLKRCG